LLQLYNIISDLKFPPQVDNFDYLDLVKKMLQKKVNHRLHRFEEIKEHPFFVNANFDWEALENMSLKPPLIPTPRIEPIPDEKDTTPLTEWLKRSLEDLKTIYVSKDSKKHVKNTNSQWEVDF